MKVRNEQLGLVFQRPYLLKELSVIENIMMPQLVGGVAYEAAHEHAHTLLQRIGLQEKSEALPSTLSTGAVTGLLGSDVLELAGPWAVVLVREGTGSQRGKRSHCDDEQTDTFVQDFHELSSQKGDTQNRLYISGREISWSFFLNPRAISRPGRARGQALGSGLMEMTWAGDSRSGSERRRCTSFPSWYQVTYPREPSILTPA